MRSLFLDRAGVSIPGPRALPLVGRRANLLRFFADPIRVMLELHARYGALAALSRDDPSWVLAFGADHNRTVLSDTAGFHNYAESPASVPEGSSAAKFNIHLIAQNGELHRRNRRMMMPAFSKARLAGYADRVAAIAERRIAELPRTGIVDVDAFGEEISLEIGMRCLFGIEEDAREIAELSLAFIASVLDPGVMLLPFDLPGTPYARFLQICERLDRAISILITHRRELGEGDDVFSALVHAADEDGAGFSEDELVGQAGMLLAASYETTARTLTGALLLLASHPEVQRALREEVRDALGDRSPTPADFAEMPTLDRVIKETMRLLPATPLLFFRRGVDAFRLGEHELPAGTLLILSPLVTHRDPQVFPEPLRFSPARWQGLELGPYDYLPFGAGARRCIGAGFAEQSLRLVLAAAVRRAWFSLPEQVHVDYRTTGVIFGFKRGLPLRVEAEEPPVARRARLEGTILELVELPEEFTGSRS